MKYSPDTCLCIVEFDVNGRGNLIYSNWIQKCQLHKNYSNQDLIDEIQTDNKSYEIKQNPTREEIRENLIDKQVEKRRVRDMGDPVVNPN